MILTTRDCDRLRPLHPDLIRVVEEAAGNLTANFIVLEGLRTIERQEQLYKKKASQTMNSRHLTGHAVDLGVVIDEEVRWDGRLYHELSDVVLCCAKQLGVEIIWGGSWKFFDGAHFELSWEKYPIAKFHSHDKLPTNDLPTLWLNHSETLSVSLLRKALHLSNSGHYSDQVELAVKAIQKKFKLTEDGIVGPETWHAIISNLD